VGASGRPVASGFVALASSWGTSVLFDNVSISKGSATSGSGRCDKSYHPLAAGQPVVVVACGDSGADARWNVTGGNGQSGPIKLIQRDNTGSDLNLCLGVRNSSSPTLPQQIGVLEVQPCARDNGNNAGKAEAAGSRELAWTFNATAQTLRHVATGGFVTMSAEVMDFEQLALTSRPVPFSRFAPDPNPVFWAPPSNWIRLNAYPRRQAEGLPGGTINVCFGVCATV